MFIVIEGGDASGKTTTINVLRQEIDNGVFPFLNSQNTKFLKSPTSPFAEIWKSIDVKEVDSLTRFYFFRTIAQNDSRVVREYLNQKYNVILERNIFSTEAFNETLDEKMNITDPLFQSKNHLIRNGLCKSDITFLLDLPDDERNARILKRAKKTGKYSWWEDPKFQHTFNEKLRIIGKREKMIVINTSQNAPYDVANIIFDNIKKTVKNQKIASIVTSLKKSKEY